MIITKKVSNIVELNTFLNGSSVGTGSAGSNTIHTATFTDSTADFGSTGLGVQAGDVLNLHGVGSFSIRTTPTAGATSLSLSAFIPQATSSQSYLITRNGVPSDQIITISGQPDGFIIVYDEDKSATGSDKAPTTIVGTDASTGVTIAARANLQAAAIAGGNHIGRSIDVRGFQKITLFVIFQDNSSSPASFKIAPRFSAMENPNPSTMSNWALEFVEDIDPSTSGEGTLQMYNVSFGSPATSLAYSVTFPVRGNFFSPIVWSETNATDEVSVLAYRLGF